MKKKSFHDSFFWAIGLLIIVSSLAIITSCSQKSSAPQNKGGSKQSLTLPVERTDGFIDHDPNTAMHIGSMNQRAFTFTLYCPTSTDIHLRRIKFSLASSTLSLFQISSMKLVDDAGTVVSLTNNPSTNTLMEMDYVLAAGTSKNFSLVLDIDPHAQERTFRANIYAVIASAVSTGETAIAVHRSDNRPVMSNDPVWSAAVDVVRP
ncbi:MAG: hypothetical protein WC477_03600 [Patescibacteria group bacterium]